MDQLALQGIPNSLQWTNQPVEWKRSSGEKLIIKAGAMTDWFIDPAGNYTKSSAPYLTFRTTDDRFMLSAKVSVNFNSMYDAGGLTSMTNVTFSENMAPGGVGGAFPGGSQAFGGRRHRPEPVSAPGHRIVHGSRYSAGQIFHFRPDVPVQWTCGNL